MDNNYIDKEIQKLRSFVWDIYERHYSSLKKRYLNIEPSIKDIYECRIMAMEESQPYIKLIERLENHRI